MENNTIYMDAILELVNQGEIDIATDYCDSSSCGVLLLYPPINLLVISNLYVNKSSSNGQYSIVGAGNRGNSLIGYMGYYTSISGTMSYAISL